MAPRRGEVPPPRGWGWPLGRAQHRICVDRAAWECVSLRVPSIPSPFASLTLCFPLSVLSIPHLCAFLRLSEREREAKSTKTALSSFFWWGVLLISNEPYTSHCPSKPKEPTQHQCHTIRAADVWQGDNPVPSLFRLICTKVGNRWSYALRLAPRLAHGPICTRPCPKDSENQAFLNKHRTPFHFVQLFSGTLSFLSGGGRSEGLHELLEGGHAHQAVGEVQVLQLPAVQALAIAAARGPAERGRGDVASVGKVARSSSSLRLEYGYQLVFPEVYFCRGRTPSKNRKRDNWGT